MRKSVIAAFAGLLLATTAHAEMAAPAPAPAASPTYGQPGVNLEQAAKAVEAAIAEAKKAGTLTAVAVVSNSGFLVHFSKMDQTQFASIEIAIDKAKAAATFRRPTKTFEDRANSGGVNVLSLRGVVASEGGIPLMRDGKVIGAIGCSGGTSAQDGQACKAGADTIK
jgi:glc operon protein GlcG